MSYEPHCLILSCKKTRVCLVMGGGEKGREGERREEEEGEGGGEREREGERGRKF